MLLKQSCVHLLLWDPPPPKKYVRLLQINLNVEDELYKSAQL